jgi:hypothetical protein
VQFYSEDNHTLAQNVGRYLVEGSNRNDGLLVIAEEKNKILFRNQMEQSGVDVRSAVRRGQMYFADAQETLSSFMRHGQPDWDLFQEAAAHAMHQVHPGFGGGMRAFGEMVGILWREGHFSAAIRLEQFWNKLLGQSDFSIFCAYSIDVFAKDFQSEHLDALLCAHTHLMPGSNGDLESAVYAAMDEILGPQARDLKVLINANVRPSWAIMPRGESAVLWLRKNLPDQAGQVLARARDLYRATPASRLAA